MNTEMGPSRKPRLTIIAGLLIVLSACGADREAAQGGAAATPTTNEATVLLAAEFGGSWPTGLDPATNTTAGANTSIMNAIFGGLFQLTADEDGRNPRIAGVLASDYTIMDDGRTIVIHLREGARFSDGTPFDAEAVRFNIERDLKSPCVCAPTGWPWDADRPVTVRDRHTVALHFERPYAAVMHAFPTTNVNWIASPAAFERMGEEAFRLKPVGAGPFRVVGNRLSSELVLERNPDYWQADRPYLDRLIFRSIGSEQAAYQALSAGDAQAYEGMTSVALIERADADERLTVTRQPPTSPYVVQLNTLEAPFDVKRAREAVYYATDVDAIREGLFMGRYPASQAFTGPGGLFHVESVPGYRSHDPERARAIVAELGGLEIRLGTLRSTVAEQVVTALQSQWRKVGIEVEIETYDVATLVQEFQSGHWQAMLQTAGSYDPESITGVSTRFRSDRPFSGVKDSRLDQLLNDAAGTFDRAERARLYFEAAKYISDNAYAPFLFAYAPTQIAAGGLRAPGLTTRIPPLMINTGVQWQDARLAQQ